MTRSAERIGTFNLSGNFCGNENYFAMVIIFFKSPQPELPRTSTKQTGLGLHCLCARITNIFGYLPQ